MPEPWWGFAKEPCYRTRILWAWEADNGYATVRQITSVMLARRYGLDAKFDKLSVPKVGQAMLRASVEVAETLRSRAEGDFNYEPSDKLLTAALAEQAELPASPVPPAPATKLEGPVFSEAADGLREVQLRRKV